VAICRCLGRNVERDRRSRHCVGIPSETAPGQPILHDQAHSCQSRVHGPESGGHRLGLERAYASCVYL
jgi:hypothetical protein